MTAPLTDKTAPTINASSTRGIRTYHTMATVEKRILDGLTDWLAGYAPQWDTAQAANMNLPELGATRQAIEVLEKELATLDKQIKKAHELLEQDRYTYETFLSRTREITEQKRKAGQSLEALTKETEIVEARRTAHTIIPAVENLLELYHRLPTPAAKNDLLKEVLEKVTYIKDRGGRWGNPDDFEIIMYPKLPMR